MILPIYSAAITYIPPPLKQSPRRQHGRVVRALEFQFGGPKFTVRLHYYLDMFSLVTSDYPYKSLFLSDWRSVPISTHRLASTCN